MRFSTILLPFVLFLPVFSSAESEIQISFDAWARATAPGATTGAIYGTLQNLGDTGVELSRVSFDGAGHSMIHRTVEQDGMMRMMHADIRLKPGESVVLEPGGLHMMLMRLAEPLRQGCQYEVTLHWLDKDTTTHTVSTGSFGQSEKPAEAAQPCP